MEQVKKEGIDGSDLVASFLTELAPSEPFTLVRIAADGTRIEKPLRVRVLSKTQELDALKVAQQTAKEFGEDSKSYGDIYREAQAVEIVWRALVRSDLYQPQQGSPYYPSLFASSKQLRDVFNNADIVQCLNAYEIVKAKYSSVQSFEPEEILQWAERLSEPLLGPFSLSHLDAQHWPALLTALAVEVMALRVSLGLPRPSSLTSSGSEPTNSESGTIGSTSSPSASLSDSQGNLIPEPSLLTSEAAREVAKKMREPKPQT
jgi:hypothetical protein